MLGTDFLLAGLAPLAIAGLLSVEPHLLVATDLEGLRVSAVMIVIQLSSVIATAAARLALKWLLVGKIRPGEHGLSTDFMRVKALADPGQGGLPEDVLGTAYVVWWMRGLGADIGENVFLNTWWLSEPDLCTIGDNACLNKHAEMQSHLIEDRMCRLDHVRVGTRAVLQAHSNAVLGCVLEPGAEIQPLSVPLPYEKVAGPSHGRCTGSWAGNPLAISTRVQCRDSGPVGGTVAPLIYDDEAEGDSPDEHGQGYSPQEALVSCVDHTVGHFSSEATPRVWHCSPCFGFPRKEEEEEEEALFDPIPALYLLLSYLIIGLAITGIDYDWD